MAALTGPLRSLGGFPSSEIEFLRLYSISGHQRERPVVNRALTLEARLPRWAERVRDAATPETGGSGIDRDQWRRIAWTPADRRLDSHLCPLATPGYGLPASPAPGRSRAFLFVTLLREGDTKEISNAAAILISRETRALRIDLAAEIEFAPGDFHDAVHATPRGSQRVGEFLHERLRAVVTGRG